MKKLILDNPFPVKDRVLSPGEYLIPQDITLAIASCAKADGVGRIVTVEKFRKPAGRTRTRLSEGSDSSKRTSRKSPAPENKLGHSVEEDKSEVEGADGDSSSNRPKPRTLTSSSLKRD